MVLRFADLCWSVTGIRHFQRQTLMVSHLIRPDQMKASPLKNCVLLSLTRGLRCSLWGPELECRSFWPK